MAVTPVTLGPSLRVWLQAGMTYLLCDESVAQIRQTQALNALPPPVVASMPPKSSAVSYAGKKAMQPADGVLTAPLRGSNDGSLAGASVGKSGAPLTFAARQDVSQDYVTWPEPWKSWAAKTAPAPVLWSYHELGADVTGLGRSAERAAFFREILAELRLPRGSSVFWPCAMPGANGPTGEGCHTLCPAPSVFAAGVDRLNPRILVVFGEQALDDMCLGNACGVFQQVMVDGRLLTLLPSINELITGASQRSSVVSFLRGVFAATYAPQRQSGL